jgi:hypothetical protein
MLEGSLRKIFIRKIMKWYSNSGHLEKHAI